MVTVSFSNSVPGSSGVFRFPALSIAKAFSVRKQQENSAGHDGRSEAEFPSSQLPRALFSPLPIPLSENERGLGERERVFRQCFSTSRSIRPILSMYGKNSVYIRNVKVKARQANIA